MNNLPGVLGSSGDPRVRNGAGMRGRVVEHGAAPRDVARTGDLELLVRVRGGDAHAANALMERHVAAVRGLGEPDVGWSGREVLHRVKNHESLLLPFRAAWLAQQVHGAQRVPAPQDDAVWDAYAALPTAWRLAVWHREVEGESARAIAPYLGLGERDTSRALVSAYAALKRGVAVAHGRAGLDEACQALHDRFRYAPPALLDRRQVARLREHGRTCDDCLPLVRDLFVVEHTLGVALAGVVLGAQASDYLATKPRRPRLRPPRPDRTTLPVRARSGLAVLTAGSLAVVATSFVLLGRPGEAPGFDRGVPYADAAIVPPTLLVDADPTSARERKERRERRAARGSTTPAAADPAPGGTDQHTADHQPSQPTEPGEPSPPTDPQPEPTPEPPVQEPAESPAESPVEQPAESPDEQPLVDVDLGAGQVTLDPGLPSGPVEVDLPVSVPVPAISVPGVPGLGGGRS